VWPTLTRARPDIAAHRFHRVSSIVGPNRNNIMHILEYLVTLFITKNNIKKIEI